MLKISIPDMSCGHCQKTLESLLNRMKGVDSCIVDLESKTIEIIGNVEWSSVESAIKEAGYSPARIET